MKLRLFAPTIILSLLLPQIVFSDSESGWYTDVDRHDTFKDAIYYMTENDYVEGYEGNVFASDSEINRAEALKVILNFKADDLEKIRNRSEVSFVDVSEDDWFYPYIMEAYEYGLIDGYDDGYFRPEASVNRAEALKMFVQALDLTLPDEGTKNWYEKYLNFGSARALLPPVENTYLYPYEDGRTEWITDWDYLPAQNLSRGELCEMIYRYMKAPYTGEIEYGVATYYGYSFNGANTASGKALDAYGFMAAHKTLPFGSIVQVTNLDNNLSVDVEIVDRGPYGEGRVIDLTPAAFEQIGSLSAGVLRTRVEVLNQ